MQEKYTNLLIYYKAFNKILMEQHLKVFPLKSETRMDTVTT